jgi:hypothetical protein
MHGDAAGETQLDELALPERETHAGRFLGLGDVPTTTMGFGQFVGRKPDVGMHNAPRRQFLVVLRGELEIITTLGGSRRLHPGDLLLADDIGSKGHISRDVGAEPLMLMAVGVDPTWEGPAS